MNRLLLRVKEFVRINRLLLEKDMGTSPSRRWFSPAYYSQYVVTLPMLRQYARGRLLDVGAGSMPYRQFIEDQVTQYDSLETSGASARVTYVGDAQDMSMIASQAYQTVICLEVLEHLPEPQLALQEIHRVLVDGGVLIVSVPHLNRLHMEPHDYYRFTKYGLRAVLENSGFQEINVAKRGGLFSFLGNQVATMLLALCRPIPGVRTIAWYFNRIACTWLPYWLDALIDPTGVYAMGYTAVAVKHRVAAETGPG